MAVTGDLEPKPGYVSLHRYDDENVAYLHRLFRPTGNG